MTHNEMPKDTVEESLLTKLQREARETYWTTVDDRDVGQVNSVIDTLIANTLKQAAEALEGMKINKDHVLIGNMEFQVESLYADGHDRALTDAQRLLGELDI
jgi:hypothetical protein